MQEEDEEEEGDLNVLLCPAIGKLSVRAAVLFLSRSSNVLPIGSANLISLSF